VDDGGDATIFLIEGLIAEKKFKATGELPDPSQHSSEDARCLFSLIKEVLQNDPDKFSKLTHHLQGISEETTTGVHRLYNLEKEGKL